MRLFLSPVCLGASGLIVHLFGLVLFFQLTFLMAFAIGHLSRQSQEEMAWLPWTIGLSGFLATVSGIVASITILSINKQKAARAIWVLMFASGLPAIALGLLIVSSIVDGGGRSYLGLWDIRFGFFGGGVSVVGVIVFAFYTAVTASCVAQLRKSRGAHP